VIAANVPRPTASLVARDGLAAIDALPAADRAHVAAELRCPRDDEYYRRFAAEMQGHGGPGTASSDSARRAITDRFYEAQCVKDETMAESIARAAETRPGALVMHITGSFHSDYGLGTAERVRRRMPAARTVVLSAVPVADISAADPARTRGRGDYVVLVPGASGAISR
jgi:uncharacterized iron-regulated protein